MRLSQFSHEQINAGNELLSAYDAAGEALIIVDYWQQRAMRFQKGELNLPFVATPQTRPEPRIDFVSDLEADLHAVKMQELSRIRFKGIVDMLEGVLEKHAGQRAYFFPRDPHDVVYLGQTPSEATPIDSISGKIQPGSPPDVTALALTSSSVFRGEKIQHALMTGDLGACALARLAIV